MYNGEPIVEYRLKYLADVVDAFVVVESSFTHSGKKKKQLYTDLNASVFAPYKDKIHFHIIRDFPDPSDTSDPILQKLKTNKHGFRLHEPAWVRESYQRDSAQKYLLDLFPDTKFMVMVCDVDEIPNRNQLLQLVKVYDRAHEGIHFEMMFLRYNFLWKEPQVWVHPFFTTDEGTRNGSFSDMRLNPDMVLQNSGWHLSYFLNPDELVRKLESFAHTEYDKPKYKKKEFIKTCMLTGRYIFEKERSLQPTFFQNLPDGWQEVYAKMNHIWFEEEYGSYSSV
jgi:beta-1,4-mannosyl-glycoprotein beta-1,4-N-acetylglucosaminyltransferase